MADVKAQLFAHDLKWKAILWTQNPKDPSAQPKEGPNCWGLVSPLDDKIDEAAAARHSPSAEVQAVRQQVQQLHGRWGKDEYGFPTARSVSGPLQDAFESCSKVDSLFCSVIKQYGK